MLWYIYIGPLESSRIKRIANSDDVFGLEVVTKVGDLP